MRYVPYLFYLSSFVLLVVIISTVFSIANAGYCSDSPTGEMSAMTLSTRALMWLHASRCDAHHDDDPEGHAECLVRVYHKEYGIPIWCIPEYEAERKKG